MFMVVSYPWPVPSAHVLFAGTSRKARGTHKTTRTAAATRGHSPQDQDQPVTQPDQQRILISPKA
jgi:hypothetical protein